MPLGEVLYESGSQLRHVYFPTTSIVSLLYVMADGRSAEIAVVGNEGSIGVTLFMGGETMPNRSVVQSAGLVISLLLGRVISYTMGGRIPQIPCTSIWRRCGYEF
jgi:hypothetical protein